MTSGPDARTFTVAQDREGFFVVDTEGQEVLTHPRCRETSWSAAYDVLRELVREQEAERKVEEDGPSDEQIFNGPGIEGGVRFRT